MSSSTRARANRRALLALALAAVTGTGTLALRRRARADVPAANRTTDAPHPAIATAPSVPLTHGAGHLPPQVASAACHAATTANQTHDTTHRAGDPRARSSAQRG